MRLLLLTPFLPHAGAAHGGGVYLHALSQALRRHAELGLVALVDPVDNLQLPAERQHWSWLQTAEHPGHRRSLPDRARTLWRWTRRPLVAAKCWQPALRPLLAEAVAKFRPDAVLVEMAQMAQYLPHLQSVPTVLTDHEAGCPANTRTGLGRFGDRRDQRLWRRYVGAFYRHAGLLQALTRADADFLQQWLQRPVAVRPPAVQVPELRSGSPAAPPRALFLGDYRHEPNARAARRIATEIWPLVRVRAPAAELWLAGPNEAPIAALTALPGVRVLGYQPDLPELFAKVRFALAPLWSGAGFRVKAATALAHGLPVVSNALGSRGLEGAGHGLVSRESAADLAAAAMVWLSDPQAAARAGAAGHAFAQQQLSPAAVASQQLANLAPLLRAPSAR
jgi:glycosyltransferase involved in cell wall biosynthesis